MSNPLINLTETELRDLSRHHIDSFENWSVLLYSISYITAI